MAFDPNKYIPVSGKHWYRLINFGPLVLISSGVESQANVAPIAWITPVSDDPPFVAIALYRKHYTTALIRRYKSFAINIPSADFLKAVKYCGSVSGRKINKIEESGLIMGRGKKIPTPHIEGCLGFIECVNEKKIAIGEEIIFIGRAVGTFALKNVFKNGYISAKARTFHHMGGGVFRLTGPKI